MTLMPRSRVVASVCVLIVFFLLAPIWLWDCGCLRSRPDRFAFDVCRCEYLKWKHGYDHVEDGMTLAEVEAIFGPGDPDGPWVAPDGWYTWDRDEIEIQIEIRNGRVSGKSIYAPGLSFGE
jgi:hypothetical protein